MRKIELDNLAYLKIKHDVLTNEVLTKIDVQMKDISIENLKTIKVLDRHIPLSGDAIKGLVESLGVSGAFIKTLQDGLGDDNAVVLNHIIKAIKGKKVSKLTFIYHKNLQEVTNIYPSGTKLIEDSQYFETLEKIIQKTPGSYLRNLVQVSNGDLKAVIANPKLEFQFGNMKDEVFTSGMTLDLNSKQMMTSFFTERLICTNGCTTQSKLMSKVVNTSEKLPNFLTAILDSDYHLSSVTEFKKRINRCYHTTASLQEVLYVDRRMEALLGKFSPELLSHMSANRLRMAFGEDYLADTVNHKFLRTDLSLWDVVNEVTALSARIEQNRIQVGEKTNLGIQMVAGHMMFSLPDLSPSNIKQIF